MRVVEQGLSFTLIDAPHPLDAPDEIETYDARAKLRGAYRVWLGWTAGTDWLHDALEREFGEDAGWYDVQSRRDATHIGASGEIAVVVLILMGAGVADFLRTYYSGFAQRLGEQSAEALLEWVRELARARRRERGLEWADGPPNFFERDAEGLATGMTGELADVLGVPEDRLLVVTAERQETLALRAVYRDTETGRTYEVLVARDSAIFRPKEEPPDSTPGPPQRVDPARRRRRVGRRRF